MWSRQGWQGWQGWNKSEKSNSERFGVQRVIKSPKCFQEPAELFKGEPVGPVTWKQSVAVRRRQSPQTCRLFRRLPMSPLVHYRALPCWTWICRPSTSQQIGKGRSRRHVSISEFGQFQQFLPCWSRARSGQWAESRQQWEQSSVMLSSSSLHWQLLTTTFMCCLVDLWLHSYSDCLVSVQCYPISCCCHEMTCYVLILCHGNILPCNVMQCSVFCFCMVLYRYDVCLCLYLYRYDDIHVCWYIRMILVFSNPPTTTGKRPHSRSVYINIPVMEPKAPKILWVYLSGSSVRLLPVCLFHILSACTVMYSE